MPDSKDSPSDPSPPSPPQSPRPRIISPDLARPKRLPPGQAETRKWPVLHFGDVPRIDLATWSFRISGLVKQERALGWEEFRKLPWIDVQCDIHCVTRWSRLNNVFSGPSTKTVLELAGGGAKFEAKFVLVHGTQGFTTNLPLDAFLGDDCLFALEHDGKPLEADHGWPVRLVVPQLYFWKSAKWVQGIELLAEDTPGFWEQNGYHMQGNPWKEERRSWE
jgi:DMSO/TMAO reductase YedYZ molybdopterin-dependent catalytic subunit